MTEEKETMDADVLFVGGGIASLSGALHLTNLIERHNKNVDQDGRGKKIDEFMIAVLEKAGDAGSHSISGAVLDPVSLKELVPDYEERGAPLEGTIRKEKVFLLTKSGKIKSPITPPPLNNHGNYVVSLSRMTKWLAQLVEGAGVDIFYGFAGIEVLYEDHRVVGVRTGDKGIGPEGEKKPNFEPGIDLRAKVCVFGDGSRGNLSSSIIRHFDLDKGKNPQCYVVGVKEVWEVPEGRMAPGDVVHTLGYPHPNHTYGGGFIYGMKGNYISVGLLTGLDYKDPYMDPHREFQKFKRHPYIAGLLRDGNLVQYGAKTAPVGGYFSIPQLCVDGGLIIGDAAGLFVSQKIKGIHAAMKSGMLAAEAVFEGIVRNDFSRQHLEVYPNSLFTSPVGGELYRARNFHQLFQRGLWNALFRGAFQYILGGRILRSRLNASPDFTHLKKMKDWYGTNTPNDKQKGTIKFDGQLTFDKETDVYYSGTTHEEQQPPHLKIVDTQICYTRCREEFGNPCLSFCPANVYEMEMDEKTGKTRMKINFSNCLHCKTCDVKDPYENIMWVPPEGGGGPKYTMV